MPPPLPRHLTEPAEVVTRRRLRPAWQYVAGGLLAGAALTCCAVNAGWVWLLRAAAGP